MGVEDYLISSTLIGVLAQRLVRVVCKKCRKKIRLTKEHLVDFGIDPSKFGEFPEVYTAQGCKECNFTGYVGRIAIFELFMIDENVRKMILEKPDTPKLKAYARKNGMRTLREDGFLKVIQGITTPEEVGDPDVIILPGSKNVISDLEVLHSSGMASVIQKKAEQGCTVVGICGGYMMLGNTIEDPYFIESQQVSCKGFSLLDMHTILAQDKTLTRKKGTHSFSKQPVAGYEIHHGVTRTDTAALFSYDDGSYCGVSSKDRKVWGSYLHGIFDSDLFRRWFINSLRQSKGLNDYDGPLYSYDLEPAFDRLADCVRKGMDMDRIYELLRL